uniref:Ovule protein n=1 Tax=Steinernema glaseri TaxID=37863 RepID=A0A1I8AE54_9BILA
MRQLGSKCTWPWSVTVLPDRCLLQEHLEHHFLQLFKDQKLWFGYWGRKNWSSTLLRIIFALLPTSYKPHLQGAS